MSMHKAGSDAGAPGAKRKKHPAAKLAASAATAITRFEGACNCAEKTDTDLAWDLLYALRATLNEIEAQLA